MAIASQITSLPIVYSTLYSDADQRKHQSSVWLAFVWGIHRSPVNSPHKWPVTRKMFPFDDVIMMCTAGQHLRKSFNSTRGLLSYFQRQGNRLFTVRAWEVREVINVTLKPLGLSVRKIPGSLFARSWIWKTSHNISSHPYIPAIKISDVSSIAVPVHIVNKQENQIAISNIQNIKQSRSITDCLEYSHD